MGSYGSARDRDFPKTGWAFVDRYRLGHSSGGDAFEEWRADGGMPWGERLARTFIKGAATGLGTFGGAVGGEALGTLCGPAAVVCIPVLGVGGGIAGQALGERAGDRFNQWLFGGGPENAGQPTSNWWPAAAHGM